MFEQPIFHQKLELQIYYYITELMGYNSFMTSISIYLHETCSESRFITVWLVKSLVALL